MSGHSKWSKIKHEKSSADAKKGQIFSKLSRAITVAAKKGGDPEGNLELKYAIGQAKAVNMPMANIERAIKKGTGELQGEKLEEIKYEALGPAGSALVIETITDNKNRTSNEIKHLLSEHGAKLTAPGSTIWLMKQKIEVPDDERENFKKLIEKLENHDDIQSIHANFGH